MRSHLCTAQNGAVGVTDQGAVIMVNITRRRVFTARRLILLATIANLGIAAELSLRTLPNRLLGKRFASALLY